MVTVNSIALVQNLVDALKKRIHQQRSRLYKQERSLEYISTLCYDQLNRLNFDQHRLSEEDRLLAIHRTVFMLTETWTQRLRLERRTASPERVERIKQTFESINYIDHLAIRAYGKAMEIRLNLRALERKAQERNKP